jgi:hypothetical protein
VRCGAVFSGFLHLHLIVRFSYYTHLHLHLLRSVLAVWCGVGAVMRFGLNSFGSDWASPNVSFNLKNPFLQLKNLANYSLYKYKCFQSQPKYLKRKKKL